MQRRFLSLLLLLFASGLGAVESHAVIFMYHRFGEPRYPSTSVRIEQFEAHLKWLAENDYSVWPLERIVTHLRRGEPIPDRTVALTMDDAYASVYRHAYPLLRKREWPFTVFVSTDAIDQRLPDYMRWEEMREMGRNGASFANHGASHTILWKRRPGESLGPWCLRVTADIDNAGRRLREELGASLSGGLFAYPYGEYDDTLADLIAENGYTGFGQHSGAIGMESDLRALPRFPISERYGSLQEFATKAATLPLNVVSEPTDPLAQSNPPVLALTLAPASLPWDKLACYSAGERINVRWNEPGIDLQVFAPQPLPLGRARYTCTVPDGDRFRWFTQPWLIQAPSLR